MQATSQRAAAAIMLSTMGAAEARSRRTGGLRVLLVGEDPLARSGLAALLAGEPTVAVAGEAAPADDLAAAVAAARAAVVLWDLGREARRGLERLATLGRLAVPALALVAGEDEAAQALAAGARGLLLRSADAGRLAAALVAVARGLVVAEEPLTQGLFRGRAAAPAELAFPLTPRELEVLQLLTHGLSNKEIAFRLGMSEHTAKFHVNAILGKLGVQGRTEAVVRAARLGLVVL